MPCHAPNASQLRILVHNTAGVDVDALTLAVDAVFPGILAAGTVVIMADADMEDQEALVQQVVKQGTTVLPASDDDTELEIVIEDELSANDMPCIVARRARHILDQAYALAYAARLESALVHRHLDLACLARHHAYLPRGLIPADPKWWTILNEWTAAYFTPLILDTCTGAIDFENVYADWLMLSLYTSVLDVPIEDDLDAEAFGLQDHEEYDIDMVQGLAGQMVSAVALAPMAAYFRVRYDHPEGAPGTLQEFLHVIESGSVLRESVEDRRGVYAMVPTLFQYPGDELY